MVQLYIEAVNLDPLEITSHDRQVFRTEMMMNLGKLKKQTQAHVPDQVATGQANQAQAGHDAARDAPPEAVPGHEAQAQTMQLKEAAVNTTQRQPECVEIGTEMTQQGYDSLWDTYQTQMQ